MIYIGIDNGVSGSIGIISDLKTLYIHTPITKQLNYTKTKKWIHRIDTIKLRETIAREIKLSSNVKVLIERPMVNPGRFQATISAIRALEATLIVLENLKLPYEYIDSKLWQQELLPKGLKGEELKEASLNIAKRLFPKIDYKGFKDGDGILITEYAKRIYKE